METIGTPGLWIAFAAVVVVALAADFLVLRSSGAHRVSFREAALWSIAWIALALVVCAQAQQPAQDGSDGGAQADREE